MAEFVNTQESSSIEVGEVVLKGRYRIFPDQPLPEFDSPSAKAYAAFDSQQSNRSLFCLICDPAVPPRRSLIGRLRGRDSTGMVVPVDEGVCDWPPAQRRVFGVLFGTPGGPRVDPTKAMTGPEILKRVVLPIADALLIAEKRGVTHRGIRVDNLFWNSPQGTGRRARRMRLGAARLRSAARIRSGRSGREPPCRAQRRKRQGRSLRARRDDAACSPARKPSTG